jgi:hypothetical protein
MAEKKEGMPVEYEYGPRDYAWDKVYLVSVDDGADNWLVIVFANGNAANGARGGRRGLSVSAT